MKDGRWKMEERRLIRFARVFAALAVLLPACMAADAGQERDMLTYKNAAGTPRHISKPSEWKSRRVAILKSMQKVMGDVPGEDRRCPLDVRVESEQQTDHFLRRKITYQSAPGERVPAYLLIPNRIKGRAPAMLCLHQTSRYAKDETVGLYGLPNFHVGQELAERGYVVLAPDYPTLGEHQFDVIASGWTSGTMKAIWDNMRGMDLLQSMPEVDGSRIGAIGHSLGGHNSLFTAAFDTRIKCVVTSCGFTSFNRYYGGKLAGWAQDRYMPRIKTRFPTPDKMPF